MQPLLPIALLVLITRFTVPVNAQNSTNFAPRLDQKQQRIVSISALTVAQPSPKKVRIAKIEIDPAHLDAYKVALAEHAKTAVRVEPGVLALQAVYDKAHPERVTVFEIYASEEAYQAHLKTPHFLTYKNGTLKMVKSLELFDVAPIALEIKPELLKN